ncbi:MAG: oligosaccharide flippase family protein [Candidatus Eisenbacteria bacterium]
MSRNGRFGIASVLSSPTSARVGRVFAIVVAAAALQVLGQTALARGLPKDEVGVVSLLLGALPLLSALSLLGQDSSSVRFLTRADASRYDARRHFRDVLLIILPLGALVALLGARFYSLAGLAAVATVTLVVSQNAVSMTTSALRAEHRYELAMTGTRLPVIVTAAALVLLAASRALTLHAALWAVIVSYASTAAFLTAYAGRRLPAGGTRVPRSVIQNGLFFLGISVSLSVMIAMDKLIIGKLMPMSELAVYATVFAVMKGFDFLFYSFTYVLMPRVNVVEKLSLKRLNLVIACVAVVVGGLYLLFGQDMVHLLFDGKYDAGAYLVAPFALSGVLKLFYSVPSSVIGGRLPRTALRQFLWFNLAGIVVNVGLDVVLILRMGLLGAAIATAVAWALRLAGGYLVMLRHRGHLGPLKELEGEL